MKNIFKENKKLKLFIRYLQLKKKGYNKERRMVDYAINHIITFDEYYKYFDKRIRRNKKNGRFNRK